MTARFLEQLADVRDRWHKARWPIYIEQIWHSDERLSYLCYRKGRCCRVLLIHSIALEKKRFTSIPYENINNLLFDYLRDQRTNRRQKIVLRGRSRPSDHSFVTGMNKRV